MKGLFDTQALWASRGNSRLRLPRGGGVPIVTGLSGGDGKVPFDYDVDLQKNLQSREEIQGGNADHLNFN